MVSLNGWSFDGSKSTVSARRFLPDDSVHATGNDVIQKGNALTRLSAHCLLHNVYSTPLPDPLPAAVCRDKCESMGPGTRLHNAPSVCGLCTCTTKFSSYLLVLLRRLYITAGSVHTAMRCGCKSEIDALSLKIFHMPYD